MRRRGGGGVVGFAQELGLAGGRAAREVAADLGAAFIDRAHVQPVAGRGVGLEGERGAAAILHAEVGAVADEVGDALGLVAQAFPVGAGHAHVGFQGRVTTHAAAQTGGGIGGRSMLDRGGGDGGRTVGRGGVQAGGLPGAAASDGAGPAGGGKAALEALGLRDDAGDFDLDATGGVGEAEIFGENIPNLLGQIALDGIEFGVRAHF